jgi:hypothetical protein
MSLQNQSRKTPEKNDGTKWGIIIKTKKAIEQKQIEPF